jgi:hypothetical protein
MFKNRVLKVYRIYFGKPHATDVRWHIFDAAFRRESDLKTLTLCAQWLYSNVTADNFEFLMRQKGSICEVCLREFYTALPKLLEQNLIGWQEQPPNFNIITPY